jgi:hypothetical protein
MAKGLAILLAGLPLQSEQPFNRKPMCAHSMAGNFFPTCKPLRDLEMDKKVARQIDLAGNLDLASIRAITSPTSDE